MEDVINKIALAHPNIIIKYNVSLSTFSSFKTGGQASAVFYIDDVELLEDVVRILATNNINYRIIGSATNIIFSDSQFQGIIIKNNCRKFEIIESSSGNLLRVQSGAISNQVVSFLVSNSYSGLENLYGIPGTIGGALRNNANLPKDNFLFENFVEKADILNESSKVVTVDKSYFKFGFDKSIIQENNHVILNLYVRIVKDDIEEIKKRADAALVYRKSTQPKDISTGVAFRNIQLAGSDSNNDFIDIFSKENYFDELSSKVKLYRDNPRYFINFSNATSSDLVDFIDKIKNKIRDKYKLDLKLNDYLV